MVKIDAPPYAPVLVLAGGLAAIWGLTGGSTGQTATVNVNVDDNGTPISGDVELVGIGTMTGSSVSFPNVPFGLYSIIVTVTGFVPVTQALTVNTDPTNLGVNVGSGGNPIALSAGAGTSTDITFTTVVTGQSGTTNIEYAAFVHDPTSGAVISSGKVTDAEANGTFSGSVTIAPTVPTGTGYPVTVEGLINSVISSNILSFTMDVGTGGGVTSIHLSQSSLTPTDEIIGITVAPSQSPALTVSVRNAANQPVATTSIAGTFGTATVPRLAAAQVVHVTVGAVTSNARTVPALAATGVTAIRLSQTNLGPTSETLGIATTPNTFSGSVTIHSSVGGNLGTAPITAGVGSFIVNRVATAQSVTATSGTVTSNARTVPALAATGVTAIRLSQTNLTAAAETLGITTTPNTFSGFVVITSSVDGNLGNATITNGTGSFIVNRLATAQNVVATQSGVTSNSRTVPALAATGVTAIRLTQTNLAPATETLGITTTPATFSGFVVMTSSVNGNIGNATITNGVGSFIVNRVATAQNIVATQSGIFSNTRIVPALAGGTLSVLINGATGNSVGLAPNVTVSGAPTAALIQYTYSVHNNVGQPMAAGSRVNAVSHANGTYTDSVSPFRQAGVIVVLPAGAYTANIFAVDGTTGGSVSGTLTFNFTV